uniref:bZIP transcription factor 2-like n=1 Tax=Erigeron canadensis TaxID=72917 RepID=UPI001CB986DB|nr:bZIP transcription factor 2-like [Erigeron canadensis]
MELTKQHPESSLDDHQESVLRKRKRMISNRESARRSRIRKKNHANDLAEQVSQLVSDNKYMAISLKDTTQMFLDIDFENSVLRAHLAELTHQFESLSEFINAFSKLTDDDSSYEASIMCGNNMDDDESLFHCINILHDDQHVMAGMFI